MNVEQYLTLLRRRRRLLLITTILGGAAGFVLSRVIPPQYTSHTVVLVEEPVVTDNYVKPAVNEDLNQRLASMQGQILSRTRLQDLVEQINSMFRNQNIHQRQKQAEDTTEFLAKQLEEAKVELDEQDAKAAAFKHLGALPEDEKTNLTLLAGMTPQLDAVTQSLNQARQEKTFLEPMLNQQLAEVNSASDGLSSKSLD